MQQEQCKLSTQVVLVGCGGIGAFAAQALSKSASRLVLVDADTVEMRNLDRQVFQLFHVGRNKAEAMKMQLHASCNISTVGTWVQNHAVYGVVASQTSAIFCAVDNHPARLACLNLADSTKSICVIAANEFITAEAYVYLPDWKDTFLDPRKYYPDLYLDKTGDPTMPCTAENNEHAPQLCQSNLLAAAFGMRLLWFWTMEEKREKVQPENRPIRYTANFARINTTTAGEMNDEMSRRAS